MRDLQLATMLQYNNMWFLAQATLTLHNCACIGPSSPPLLNTMRELVHVQGGQLLGCSVIDQELMHLHRPNGLSTHRVQDGQGWFSYVFICFHHVLPDFTLDGVGFYMFL